MGSQPGNSRSGSQRQLWDAQIRALARKQHGLITRWQLRRIGLSDAAIDGRLAAGHLIAIHDGVYFLGAVRDDPLARAMAAVLAGGPGAVLSHGSAAWLWDLGRRWALPAHITVPGDRRPPGIVVHRSKVLTRADIRTNKGIRVTSVARTLLDVAPELGEARLARMVNDARREGLLRPAQLADALSRCPRRPGARRLLRFADPERPVTRSEFEEAFLAFIGAYGLPIPQVNVHVAGYEVDMFFAPQRLIVELDGWRFHQGHDAFVGDRERDAATLDAGCATIRVTWERLQSAPVTEAARLRRILRARDRSGGGAG